MSRLGAAMDIRFGASVEEFLNYLTDLGLNHLELKREYLEGHPDTPTAAEIGDLTDQYGCSVTFHAPFRDWNMGSFSEDIRGASVRQVKKTLDDAATAGAGAVVVHGGSVPNRYPEWVHNKAAKNAHQSLVECAEYAREVGVPLCLENQPQNDAKRRYTTTLDALDETLANVPVDGDHLGVTLDVGHAKANGYDWADFADRFGDRIRVCHLHDNDGTGDHHDPLTDYQRITETVSADYFVFEMKTIDDIARCLEADVAPLKVTPTSGGDVSTDNW